MTYDEVAKLTADEAESYDYFGYSVAIAGGTVVVGAYGDDDASGCTDDWCNSGSVYIFHTSDGGSTYDLVAKLTATDAVESDHFGESVAIHSSLVVVGAPHHDDADWDSGAVYVFRTEDGGASWSPLAKLTPSDGVEDAEFVLGRSSWQLRGGGAPDDDGIAAVYTCCRQRRLSRSRRLSRPTLDDGSATRGLVISSRSAPGTTITPPAKYTITTTTTWTPIAARSTSSTPATAAPPLVQVAKLKADDPAAYDDGYAVAMSGDVVVRVKTNMTDHDFPGAAAWARITRKNVDFRTGRRGRAPYNKLDDHLGRWLGLRLQPRSAGAYPRPTRRPRRSRPRLSCRRLRDRVVLPTDEPTTSLPSPMPPSASPSDPRRLRCATRRRTLAHTHLHHYADESDPATDHGSAQCNAGADSARRHEHPNGRRGVALGQRLCRAHVRAHLAVWYSRGHGHVILILRSFGVELLQYGRSVL